MIGARRDAAGHLVVRAVGPDRRGVRLRVPTRDGLGPVLGDEEPGPAVVRGTGLDVVPTSARLAPTSARLAPTSARLAPPGRVLPAAPRGSDQREAAGQLLATKPELQLACAERRTGIPGDLGLEGAPVPADGVARAVFAPGNDALEVQVLDRMVLGAGGEAALAGVARGTLRDCPRREDAVDLEPQVVVEPAGSMAMDHEPPAPARCRRARQVRRRAPRSGGWRACSGLSFAPCGRASGRPRLRRRGLGRPGEVALRPVPVQ